MKKILSVSLLAACLALVTLGYTGCNAGPYQQTAPAVVAQTNAAGIVTPAQPPQYAINPAYSSAIETAKTVSAFLPPPYDLVVPGALTAAGSILAFFLRRKNGQLSTTQTILNSVITGVEAAGDAATKLQIQSHANAAGIQDVLHPLVQQVTANSPPAMVLAK